MRKFYRARRSRIVAALNSCAEAEKLTILEEDAGLHFLLKVDTELSDQALTALCARAGIRIRALSSYYHGPVPPDDRRCMVVNYAALREEDLDQILKELPLPFDRQTDIMEKMRTSIAV